jgi:hypothetical protein
MKFAALSDSVHPGIPLEPHDWGGGIDIVKVADVSPTFVI